MAGVAVVTDSTCDLPHSLVEEIGLRVVPLSVAFGDEVLVAGVTLQTEEFYRRLTESSVMPTTSQPAPVWFDEAFADCVDEGYEAVVALHCSAALSGTVAVARERARHTPLMVEVVDSRLIGGSLGLAALAAHRAAVSGGSVEDVVAAAEGVRAGVTSLVVVDTLEYLRRGGRLSGHQAVLGTALRVKPVLHLTEDGRVEVIQRARTWRKARERLVELAVSSADGGEADVIVVHSLAPGRAAEVRDELRTRLHVRELLEGEIGPVVGSHTGPGAVGVAVARVDRA